MRHPCDVVTSCFLVPLKLMMQWLILNMKQTISFYNTVLDLFEFYQGEINFNYYVIKYEDVVSDFKNQIIKLINFLDLDYEEKLKEFYITAKRSKISTPSYNQVINPLYSSSINRWKNFKNSDLLVNNLSRWIKKYKY